MMNETPEVAALTPLQALEKYFGFPGFREGQEAAIHRVLHGQHTLLVMPTGSGKSLTYQLPALLKSGLTLVISPLIALMKDQVDQLTDRGVAATYINSSLPAGEVNQRIRAVLEGDIKLLYIAPERLRSRRFTQMLANTQVDLLAVDEAHCISQWGHDFRPDYLQIGPTWQAMGRPTLLATTATATPQVQQDILKLLGLERTQPIVTGFNRPNLTFRVELAPTEQIKRNHLRDLLKNDAGSSIIYAATRRKTEEVAEFIRYQLGIPTEGYHGGMDRDLRDRVQNHFMSDRIKVVVATNAFGMGVDKADVRQVIHYNLPSTVEAYYQEAGRAGRDGDSAECILLYGPEDQRLQQWMIDSDTPRYDDLFQIYTLLSNAATEGEVNLMIDELAASSGMHPVKIRITLSELEQADVIYHLGNQGNYSSWKIQPLLDQALEKRAEAVDKRARIRHELLAKMLNYAYATTCRRQYLLDYFGDTSRPKAPHCCDNHQTTDLEQLPKAVTPQEWVPLIALEMVRSLKQRAVGRNRLAQILSGSQSTKIRELGYDQHRFYGKLSHLSQKQLLQLVDSLLQGRYLQLTGGKLPVLGLTPLGLKALEIRAALPIQLPELAADPTKDTKVVGSTVRQTLAMFRQGLSPSQIAQERSLTEMTIYTHLADLIKQGDIELPEVVPPEIAAQVRKAADQAGRERLSPIKALLPESISFDQIKCVLAAEKHVSTASSDPPPAQPSFIAMVPAKQPLSPQQAAEKLEALRQWRTEEANKAQIPSYIIFSNKVLEAIVQQNPQTLGELGTIKGIGPAKLESYGKAVLAILHPNTATADHAQEIVPPLQSVSRPTPKAQSAQLPSTFSTAGKTDDVPTIILKVISDLEGLLTPQTLTDLLTAAPNKVVPFSDHQAKGYFFGKVEEAAIDQQIRKMMTAQEIVVNRRQRLIVTKKTEE